MAARKATPEASKEAAAEEESRPVSTVGEVHARGGWDVGYTGDRVDPADDGVYTVTGVINSDAAEGE